MTYLERYNKAFKNIDTREIKYGDYVIAYIDLLGVKDLLKQDNGATLNRMKYLYDRLLCYVDSNNIDFFGLNGIKVKIFSDNIIIASEINDDLEASFKKVFRLTKILQGEALIVNGWLLRGGISRGNLYIDDIFTLGNSIITAYNIESQIANYPRVIIDKKIIESIDLSMFIMPYGIEEIYTDFDGEKYINFLSFLNKDCIANICDCLYKHYKEISEQEQLEKVKQKYNWLLHYVDVVLRWCDTTLI